MTTVPRVTVAMLGARMHYAVPRLLYEAGLLERFFTDSYIGNKPWLEVGLRAVPAGVRPRSFQRWLGRKDDVLPPEKVISFEHQGLWYGHARQRASGRAEGNEVFLAAARQFNRNILQKGLGNARIIWGFNNAALELFRAAKSQGRVCVLEQAMLPRALTRQLLSKEQQRWPDWEAHSTNWAEPLATDGREEAEWELADAIVAGSDFVRSGLIELGVAPRKVHVIPYGVNAKHYVPNNGCPSTSSTGNDRLRVLFAGKVGLRKGVPYLLEAASTLEADKVDFRLAGTLTLNQHKLEPFTGSVKVLGAVPRPRMNELFQWADVFVLPSIVEGSATVTYEAIMAGCPVIATPNAGSIITDSLDGFIIPMASSGHISASLQRYLDEPELLSAHRRNLFETREQASIARYGADLVKLINKIS